MVLVALAAVAATLVVVQLSRPETFDTTGHVRRGSTPLPQGGVESTPYALVATDPAPTTGETFDTTMHTYRSGARVS